MTSEHHGDITIQTEAERYGDQVGLKLNFQIKKNMTKSSQRNKNAIDESFTYHYDTEPTC